MRLNIGFSNYTDDGLADKTDVILTALTGNTSLPTVTPTLADIKTAVTALRDAIALPRSPGRAQAITAARGTLIALLGQLGQFLDTRPNVTEAMLATTGFDLPKRPVRATAPPGIAQNLRLFHGANPGEVRALCDALAGARSFEVEWTLDPNAGPWSTATGFPNRLEMILTGLPRGKDIWVRVRGLGTRGFGPWSDPATIMVT